MGKGLVTTLITRLRRLFRRPVPATAKRDGLRLRPPVPGDLEFYRRHLSDPVVSAELEIDGTDDTWVRAILERDINADPRERHWFFVVESDGAPVGTACLYPAGNNSYSLECGVAILASHRRRGHASASFALLAEFARGEGAKRVVGRCFTDNDACGRALARAGFLFEGVERCGYYNGGRFHDSNVYAFITDLQEAV